MAPSPSALQAGGSRSGKCRRLLSSCACWRPTWLLLKVWSPGFIQEACTLRPSGSLWPACPPHPSPPGGCDLQTWRSRRPASQPVGAMCIWERPPHTTAGTRRMLFFSCETGIHTANGATLTLPASPCLLEYYHTQNPVFPVPWQGS